MELQEILERTSETREKYPEIFNDDCGLNEVCPHKKLHAVKSWGRSKGNEKRRVTLKVSSFVGISAEAEHVYGKLEVQGVFMEKDDEKDCSTNCWECDKTKPLQSYLYRIPLQRYVTEKDKKQDEELKYMKKWEGYHVGDLTDRFDTLEELEEFAKEVFKARFKGDWELWRDVDWLSGIQKIDIEN
ncbi:hypothetical protein LJC16_02240 [Bacteroidales bacterium OttesenSCG-928-C19]|nr:hypothetical protein [Bacteroidales bacterium OttesenSCG-928-C19]